MTAHDGVAETVPVGRVPETVTIAAKDGVSVAIVPSLIAETVVIATEDRVSVAIVAGRAAEGTEEIGMTTDLRLNCGDR